jgi:agmatine deiminase
MIADKDTNTVYFSNLLEKKYPKTWLMIDAVLKEYEVPHFLLEKTNDIWARDYMPIQISKSIFIEYRYDPDYLQGKRKGYRDLKTYPDIVCDKLNIKTEKSDLIMDGGNVVKTSDAIILTDKIFEENKTKYKKKKELISKLHDLFEVEKIVIPIKYQSD